MKSTQDNKTFWRWWSKALGEKASKCDHESDRIAVIRTIIFLTYLITNMFIVAGVIRHWNDEPVKIQYKQEQKQHYGPVGIHKRLKAEVL